MLRSPAMCGLRGHTDAEGMLHLTPARWADDALVPEATWQKVQRLLGGSATVKGVNGDTYRVRTKPKASLARHYLLSGTRRGNEVTGVLRCSRCGSPLAAQTQGRRNGERVPAYQCHPKLDPQACGGIGISPADEVEAHVVAVVQKALARSPKLRRRLQVTDDRKADALRARRDAAKARMLDAGQRLGQGAIDSDTFDAMYGAARADYDSAESELQALAVDTVLPSAEDVMERWESLPLKTQRAVIAHLIERIVVRPGAGRRDFDESRLSAPVWRA